MSHAPPQVDCICKLIEGVCTEVCAVTPHNDSWTQQQWDRAHAANVEALGVPTCTGC